MIRNDPAFRCRSVVADKPADSNAFACLVYLLAVCDYNAFASRGKRALILRNWAKLLWFLAFQILPVILAMINLYFVFEDDFVKTMQAATGRGELKRIQVVLVKWCEMMVSLPIDCMALFAAMCGAGISKGIVLKGSRHLSCHSADVHDLSDHQVMAALVMIVIFDYAVGINPVIIYHSGDKAGFSGDQL